MKKIIGLLILGGLFMSSCEEDPLIQTDGFQSRPVIYSIIDSDDSVHFIRLGRFFSGLTDPEETAKIPDSIYFRTANLKVTLRTPWKVDIKVPVEYYQEEKNPGTFHSGSFGSYRFRKKLIFGEYPNKALIYDSMFLEVDIPGLPLAKCSTSLVWPPKIWWPIQAAQYIFIHPDNPMRVLWSGDAWNEIDVSFKVMEQYADSTISKTFFLQKTNDVHFNGKYYEIKVPYELIVQMLDRTLKIDRNIVRRYFGPFRIDILTGNEDFDLFMKFREGLNDFNFNPHDNVENGIGMLSGKSSTIKKEMHLDQATRLKFALEPALMKFRFIEY